MTADTTKGRASIEPRWIPVGGPRVAYRLAGQGPLLLLVHGMAGSSETWRYVMPALAERFTVLAPDLLGQGLSDQPPVDYSLDTHAETLRGLLLALGFERATVVGQSLGGGVAMQLAHRYPEVCERLVLLNSGGFGRGLTVWLRLLSVPGFESIFPLFCGPRLRDAGETLGAWLDRAGVHSTPARQEIWGSYASLADPGRRHAFFRSLREVVELGGQAVSALGRVNSAHRLPTLIVWGAEDPFIPVGHAFAAHEAIPGSRLEIFEGVGHYPHCEAPGRFVSLLGDFVDSTTPARLPPRTEVE
jgi:pimeloyl-ACP methyl ester carboxylesterase